MNIEYNITLKYTKNNIIDFLCREDDKKWFLHKNDLKNYIEKYILKIPEPILKAFDKEGWKIILTNENLEDKFGYDFEIYGVTDKNYKTIYTYAYPVAITYGLGHEIGHFVDIFLGNISRTNQWKNICKEHKELSDMPIYYFTLNKCEFYDEEYFADSFLLFLNDKTLLKRCNESAYNLFDRLFNNIDIIIDIISKG